MENEILTAKEVAEIIGCSPSLIYRADMRAALGGYRVGTRGLRFTREKVEAYKKANAFQASDQPDEAPKKRKRKSKKLTSRHDLW